MFRPDPTLEVSQSDIVLDSSTQELDVADLSIDASQSMSLPPETHRPPRSRRHGPWVVWGLVGGAWCVMIALALLAVEDSSKSSMRADGAVRVTHEQAAMGAVTAEDPAPEARMPSLETTAPAAQALKAEEAAKPVLEAAAVGALNPASTALGESDKPALAKSDEAQPAKQSTVEKRRAAKRKHKAQFQKRHKKKTRHAKHRAKKG
jgi:hypothetical protein